MFGSQVLEVVVGLVLVYLFLCIGCSGIKEFIASVFSLRAKTLENALRNMLKDSGTDYASLILGHPLIAGTAPEGQKPSYIASRMFASALFDVVAPADPNQPRTMDALRCGVAKIPGTRLRTTLLNIIASAGQDIELARQKVEHWFDDTMDRVSGWYKRIAQWIIFGAALALCFALNADTLMVVKELWTDQALGRAVVAQAEKRAQAGTPADPSGTTESLQEMEEIAQELRETNAPPIGWASGSKNIRSWPAGLWPITLKILGILLTSFAVLMGAPFWFDLLNKIVNLRLTGDPPNPAK